MDQRVNPKVSIAQKLRSWSGRRKSVGRCNERSCKHGEKAGKIREGCEAKAGVSGQRHDGVGESNPGRCDKPTVTLKRTHPTPFYESQTGIPGPYGSLEVTFVTPPERCSRIEVAGHDCPWPW